MICNICGDSIVDHERVSLLCGHSTHNRCLVQQGETGRYICGAGSCREPFFCVRLGTFKMLRERRISFLIPRTPLNNETQRVANTIANIFNINMEFFNIFVRIFSGSTYCAALEDALHIVVSDLISEVMLLNRNDGVLVPRVQAISDDFYCFYTGIILLGVFIVAYVAYVACLGTLFVSDYSYLDRYFRE